MDGVQGSGGSPHGSWHVDDMDMAWARIRQNGGEVVVDRTGWGWGAADDMQSKKANGGNRKRASWRLISFKSGKQTGGCVSV